MGDQFGGWPEQAQRFFIGLGLDNSKAYFEANRTVYMAHVRAPTLLIVGGRDDVVLGLNRQAAAQLHCPHQLEIVPNATHLFEERGALEQVADLAATWFSTHLAPTAVVHRSRP